MHNLDLLFLKTFLEVYLLNYLISSYGTSIAMIGNQIWKQQKLSLAFSVDEYS